MNNSFLAARFNHPLQINVISRVMSYFSRCRERRHYQLELVRLSMDAPHMIEDIGLTKERVESELAQPFWR